MESRELDLTTRRNGFRTDYLIKCEDALKTEFPKTDLQTFPHITSKLTAWKKYYSSIVTAHLVTRLRFNTTTSQIDCTDEQWDSVVKVDPNMKGMQFKEWPYFLDWVEIFGLDRATGSVTEDVVEMAKRLKQLYGKPPSVEEVKECDGANFRSDGDQQPPSEGIYGTQTNDPTETNNTGNGKNNNATDKACGSKKKRKLNSELTGNSNIKCILGEFCLTTGDRLATIVGRI
ncbi:hypothetical protein ACS0TY_005780 [Phlomoides rotata]